ncbi:unnamed protein product [Musa acuminata subsp. malaccensis]|uniref:(wild Malaysian banana) hypothetical protein n=1 Tax=Musa acuminata subsp. malaccensis TaxID=214687 RepID=A0A804JIM0_MUSAM|nr:unnamed protein product [Musa acuminata subsp. malaccensis]
MFSLSSHIQRYKFNLMKQHFCLSSNDKNVIRGDVSPGYV